VTARVPRSVDRFSLHQELLNPLLDFLEARGRLPSPEESGEFGTAIETFGSLKRAYRVIVRATGEEPWIKVRHELSQDLLVYLALARFGGRPRRKILPLALAEDVRAFFGTYRKACEAGDELLFRVGQQAALDAAFASAVIGKRTQSALYVHKTALEALPPVLRVYEGCARVLVGEVEGANIVKLHRDHPQVSYLSYPDFDSDPHPALQGSLLVNFRSLKTSYREYGESDNPPILHRKEQFVAEDYEGREAFSTLTLEEEEAGLYEHPSLIGTRLAWDRLLADKGLRINSYRVLAASADPC
jgi:DNA phosphorothioation-associated putative methyltransferase